MARLIWAAATARLLPRRWRKRLRKRLAARFPGPFDVTLDGVAFRAYPAENHCDRTMLGRGVLPESGERALVAPLLLPGMVFVDIGANVGTWSLWVARHAARDARIVALEPHPRTFAKLAYNIAANAAAGVTALQLGVAGEEGTMTLHSDGGGNIGGASLLPDAAGSARAETVAVRPLAKILAGLGIDRIDLVKIDVEGFEDRALLPLFEQADQPLWPRAILIEVALSKLWETDCIARLTALGYREAGRTPENILFRR